MSGVNKFYGRQRPRQIIAEHIITAATTAADEAGHPPHDAAADCHQVADGQAVVAQASPPSAHAHRQNAAQRNYSINDEVEAEDPAQCEARLEALSRRLDERATVLAARSSGDAVGEQLYRGWVDRQRYAAEVQALHEQRRREVELREAERERTAAAALLVCQELVAEIVSGVGAAAMAAAQERERARILALDAVLHAEAFAREASREASRAAAAERQHRAFMGVGLIASLDPDIAEIRRQSHERVQRAAEAAALSEQREIEALERRVKQLQQPQSCGGASSRRRQCVRAPAPCCTPPPHIDDAGDVVVSAKNGDYGELLAVIELGLDADLVGNAGLRVLLSEVAVAGQ